MKERCNKGDVRKEEGKTEGGKLQDKHTDRLRNRQTQRRREKGIKMKEIKTEATKITHQR